jgi:hypothetical protein
VLPKDVKNVLLDSSSALQHRGLSDDGHCIALLLSTEIPTQGQPYRPVQRNILDLQAFEPNIFPILLIAQLYTRIRTVVGRHLALGVAHECKRTFS